MGVNELVFVYASITNQYGTTVPDVTNKVAFIVDGDAEVVYSNIVNAEAGTAAILLKISKTPGTIKVIATAPGLETASITIDAKNR